MYAKTDNFNFNDKVALRLTNLPAPGPLPLRVLDLFSGDGLIWDEISRLVSPRPMQIFRIDQRSDRKGLYLIGDNNKFPIDYSKFDIIDLDGYGVPFAQLDRLIAISPAGGKSQTIFITMTQTAVGTIPYGLLEILGYSRAMIAKCPSMFMRHGLDKFLSYLAIKGFETATILTDSLGDNNKEQTRCRNVRHSYICIKT